MMVTGNMIANNAWLYHNQHNKKMSTALERLSSGLRINRAEDDPAGLGVSEKMKAQLTVLEREQANAMDELSMADTQDGVLAGVHDILNRLTDLAAQAASGISDEDRALLDIEYQELLHEIDRSGRESDFGSVDLFRGSALGEEPEELVPETTYTLSGDALNSLLDSLDRFADEFALQADDGTGKSEFRNALVDFTNENIARLSETGGAGGEYTVTFSSEKGISVRENGVDSDSLGLDGTNLLSEDSARAAMDAVKGAVNKVSAHRAQIGATRNRLERTIEHLSETESNLMGSLSNITDADMAKEMLTFVREKMLTQVSMFVMRQGAQMEEGTLLLLRA